MWYLSRTPSISSSSQDHSYISPTSIFTTNETGFFDDLSFIITNEDNQQHAHQNFGNKRQWFTYECAPMQFIGVAVPYRTQVIAVMPDYFLCARLISWPLNVVPRAKSESYAKLCTFSRKGDELVDVPSCMEVKEGCVRNLLTAACALVNGWLYVAGGYKAISSTDAGPKPLTPLDSAERFNLETLQWETLSSMCEPQAYAKGIAHWGLFYCIGDENNGHSAQIYHPNSNKWSFVKHFIPEEVDGYSVTSVDGQMILLTLSTFRGIKLWRWIHGESRWILGQVYADNKLARSWLDQRGVRLVRLKRDVFIMVGVNSDFCWVDGLCAWPVLPAPSFRLCDEHKIEHSGKLPAFRLLRRNNAPSWRQYPVYRTVGLH